MNSFEPFVWASYKKTCIHPYIAFLTCQILTSKVVLLGLRHMLTCKLRSIFTPFSTDSDEPIKVGVAVLAAVGTMGGSVVILQVSSFKADHSVTQVS